MKNAAHPAANEAKKVHTVAKGTLSLAAQHNKRSTDVQHQPEEKKPEAADKTLTDAVQNLHDNETGKAETGNADDKATEKQTAVEEVVDLLRVVMRVDHRNNFFAFDVDSVTEKKTLFMWDLTHGEGKEEVPLAFYKSLKPSKDQKQKDRAVKMLTEKLGVNRIGIRDRLVKGSLERDEDGKVDAADMDAFKRQVLEALDKFRAQILAA